MKINERITIYLSSESGNLEAYGFLKELGFKFVDSRIEFRGDYKRGFVSDVKTKLKKSGLNPEMHCGIAPVFSNEDFTKANFLGLFFEDYDGKTVDFSQKCQRCGRRTWEPKYATYVRRASTERHAFAFGTVALVVSKQLREKLEANKLLGFDFIAFDEARTYFFLKPTASLGPLIIKDEESEGFTGSCSVCGTPLWERYFGPFRHSNQCWNGEDIIRGGFLKMPVFSKRAADVVKKLVPSARLDFPVMLE